VVLSSLYLPRTCVRAVRPDVETSAATNKMLSMCMVAAMMYIGRQIPDWASSRSHRRAADAHCSCRRYALHSAERGDSVRLQYRAAADFHRRCHTLPLKHRPRVQPIHSMRPMCEEAFAQLHPRTHNSDRIDRAREPTSPVSSEATATADSLHQSAQVWHTRCLTQAGQLRIRAQRVLHWSNTVDNAKSNPQEVAHRKSEP
jgi:hypothetical protein